MLLEAYQKAQQHLQQTCNSGPPRSRKHRR